MKYGFNGLLNRKNSNVLPNLNFKEGTIKVVRVVDIILNDNHHNFEKLGGWSSIGTIEFEFVDKRNQLSNNFAKPINSNLKKFPLKNEYVYLISFPNINNENNPYSSNSYYIDVLNLWNTPHHNGYPNVSDVKNSYSQTQIGNVQDNNIEQSLDLGKTFKEKSNINPLLPFEGDFIIEGRWGNSIRFGSTVKSNANNWSQTGENGDSILIIKNTNPNSNNDNGWIAKCENINEDDSSIYLTSTQNIPIKVSRNDYTSYTEEQPTSPGEYSGKQIILNSGRLLFNSTTDHILLSSAKSINLNSKESVNIDTKKILMQADKIFLGKEDLATEPLLLGNTTVEFLSAFVDCIENFAKTLKQAETSPTIQGSPSTLPSLNLEATKMLIIINNLKQKLKVLTSKRNFTL